MFKFQCHGSYLRDFDVRGDVLRVGDITDDQADAMLTASPHLAAAKTWDTRHGLLLNKGFAIVHRDEESRPYSTNDIVASAMAKHASNPLFNFARP